MSARRASNALIADEQRHLDAASAAIRAELARRGHGAGAAADRQAAQALVRMNGERRAALDVASKMPFFGMIESDEGLQVRLGAASIWNHDEVLVSSWRAPAAEAFYLAVPEERRGQRLRRRLAVSAGTVQSVEEERLTETDAADRFRTAAAHTAAITRNGRMAEIMATIQPDQYAIVAAPATVALGVQGGPGTGKTAVALHRAAWLLYRNAQIRADGVLFVGPGRLFLDFVSGVLPALGEDSVTQLQANRVLAEGSRLLEETSARAQLKGDLKMAEVLRRALGQRISPRGPEAIDVTVGMLRVEISRDDVAASLEVARRLKAPAARQRKRFLDELISRARPVSARNRMIVTGLEDALRGHPDLQRAAERLWPQLSARQLVTDLLSSRKRLRAAADGLFTESELLTLHRPDADQPWTEADLPLLDEARSLIVGVPTTYGHVIVDEVQSLSPMQLHCLARRARTNSMTLVGDISQRNSPWRYGTWEHVFQAAGQSVACLAELTVSYRVPSEILQLASGLLNAVAPELRMPTGVRPAEEPLIVGQIARARLPLALRGVLERFAAKPGQVAVVCDANSLLPALRAARDVVKSVEVV